jgi:hypothetical protein
MHKLTEKHNKNKNNDNNNNSKLLRFKDSRRSSEGGSPRCSMSTSEFSVDFYWRRADKLELDIKTMLRTDDKQRFRSHDRATAPGSGSLARLGRLLMTLLSNFNRVDPLAQDSFKCDANAIRLPGKLSRLGVRLGLHRLYRSEWHRSRGAFHRRWPAVVYFVWLAILVHVSVCLVFRYKQDACKFRMRRVAWINETHPEQYSIQQLESADHLRACLDESDRLLRLVAGDHQLHVSYVFEVIYLALISMTTVFYSLLGVYFKYKQPFCFDFFTSQLDHQRALDNCRRTIKQQACLLLDSNRRFTRALVEFSEKSIGRRLFLRRRTEAGLDQLGRNGGATAAANQRNQSSGAISELLKAGTAAAAGLDGQQEARLLAIANRSLACRQLKHMIRDDQLIPMNRSREWLDHKSQLYALINGCGLVAGMSANYMVSRTLIDMARLANERKQLTLADCLGAVEILFMLLVCTLAGMFYVSVIVFSAYDQIVVAKQLLSLIKKIVALNELRFHAILRPMLKQYGGGGEARWSLSEQLPAKTAATRPHANGPPPRAPSRAAGRSIDVGSSRWRVPPPSLVNLASQRLDWAQFEDKMNHDLLLLVMHYRLFKVRLMALTRRSGFLVLCTIFMAFLLPIVGRIHLPYFMDSSVRTIINAICLITLSTADISLVPVCYLHRRCLDVYNALNSVLAHATDVARSPEGIDIYDRHLISTLRKELSHHEGIAAMFATKFAGISVTYPNLVRIHLYFSFLMLSLIYDESSEQELTVGIFSDPFGLY